MPEHKKFLKLPELSTLLVCVLIIFGALLYINYYGVNVPYWDDWDVQVHQYLTGDFANLRLDQLTAMRNQHRYFTPRIILGLLDLVDPLNTMKYLYAQLAIGIAIFAFLYLMYRRHADSPHFYVIGIPFAILFFGIVLWDSWTHSAMMPGFSTLLGSVIALWAVTCLRPCWRTLVIALVAASAAALGNTPGNFLLIGLAPLMAWAGWRNPYHFLVWAVVTAAITVWYLVDLAQPTSMAQEIQRVSLLDYGQFILLFIISPVKPLFNLAENYGMLAVISALCMVGFGVTIWVNFTHIQAGMRKSLPWVALAVWTASTGIGVALGRAGLIGGLEHALSSRFQPYGVMFWMAFAALLFIALTEPCRPDRARTALLPLVIAFIIGIMVVRANFIDLMFDLTLQRDRLATGYECVRHLERATDECLELLYPHAEHLRMLIPELAARGVSFLRLY